MKKLLSIVTLVLILALNVCPAFAVDENLTFELDNTGSAAITLDTTPEPDPNEGKDADKSTLTPEQIRANKQNELTYYDEEMSEAAKEVLGNQIPNFFQQFSNIRNIKVVRDVFTSIQIIATTLLVLKVGFEIIQKTIQTLGFRVFFEKMVSVLIACFGIFFVPVIIDYIINFFTGLSVVAAIGPDAISEGVQSLSGEVQGVTEEIVSPSLQSYNVVTGLTKNLSVKIFAGIFMFFLNFFLFFKLIKCVVNLVFLYLAGPIIALNLTNDGSLFRMWVFDVISYVATPVVISFFMKLSISIADGNKEPLWVPAFLVASIGLQALINRYCGSQGGGGNGIMSSAVSQAAGKGLSAAGGLAGKGIVKGISAIGRMFKGG